MNLLNRTCCLLFSLLSASSLLYAGEAHVHGQARLEIAVEGEQLTIRLESPLDNLLGFEHAPRNERERQAVRRMKAQFNDGARQFRPAVAAQCRMQDVTLDAPALAAVPAQHAAVAAHDHDDEHAELSATWRFHCASPAGLRELTVELFADFPGLRRVDAVAIGATSQGAGRLSAGQRRIRW